MTLDELGKELGRVLERLGVDPEELEDGEAERLLDRLELLRHQAELLRQEVSGAVDVLRAELAAAQEEESRERNP